MEKEGNKADASSQRVKLAKQEQTEDSGLYWGLVWGEGPQTQNAEEGSRVYVLVKLPELDLTLNLSVLWREIELRRDCRLYKALFTSDTKLICLRARHNLGNRGKLFWVMKPRRHVHVLDEWWRGKTDLVSKLIKRTDLLTCHWQDRLCPQIHEGAQWAWKQSSLVRNL